MPILRKGQKVTIFQDPISQHQSEGEATLIAFKASDDDNTMELWEVRFDGDHPDEIYDRTIKVK